MIGNFDFAFEIFGAGERFGKNRREQIIAEHALNIGGHAFAAAEAEKS